MTLFVGDVLDYAAQLAPQSIQTIVTSPPYFGLRRYLPTDHPMRAMEIGTEQTPEEYVERLVAVFRALRPALKDDATLWINIGDSYCTRSASRKQGNRDVIRAFADGELPSWREYAEQGRVRYSSTLRDSGLKDKDLIGIPWLLAFALRADGWWLRSEITWAKVSVMPESIRDRPTSSTEKIFLLAKSASYFCDMDAIREPYAEGSKDRYRYQFGNGESAAVNKSPAIGDGSGHNAEMNPLGRNARNFWLLGPDAYPGSHYATFPREIPRRAILAGTSARGECSRCGKAWRRVVETDNPSKDANIGIDMSGGAARTANPQTSAGMHRNGGGVYSSRVSVGWEPQCSCSAPIVPQIVCDPFMGSGTTARVAIEEGRRWTGCDIDERNARLVEGRTDGAQVRMQLGGTT